MLALLKKEIQSFLSSLIGYIVMVVFLLILNLFLWVFPGDFNILDAGYATINPLFVIAPWVFMFLIPMIYKNKHQVKKNVIWYMITLPLLQNLSKILIWPPHPITQMSPLWAWTWSKN